MNEPPRILIVDDDTVILRATSRLLESAGYQVTEAANGAECLRLAREQSPDLILLDVVLPDESGVQICQRLKADSQLVNIFVVFLSSIQTESDSQAQGLKAGADGYIVRPISNRELVARVRALLRIKSAEDALRASEERFRAVIKNAGAGYFRIGRDGCFENVNAAWLRMHGYDALSQVIGKHFALTQVDADLDAAQKNVERLFSGEPIPAGEFSRRCRDGSIGYHSFSANPIWRAGQVVGLEGFLIDITERKRAEEGVRLSEARYRSLVETQADIISRSDPSGNLTFVNDSYCRTFGVPRDQLLGTNFTPTVFPEDVPIMLKVLEAIKQPPYRKYAEIRNVTSQGVRWFIWDNSAVLDEQGHILEFQGMGRDITDRKHAEEELRNAAREWQTTFDAVTDAVWLLDKEQRIVLANQATQRVFNLTPENIIGEHCWQVVHGTPEPIPECPILRMRKSLHRESMELAIGERWVEVTADPILDEVGRYAGAVHIVGDITQRKRAEEAVRASEAHYRELADSIADVFFAMDGDLRYTFWNRASEQLTGISAQDAVGKSLYELFPDEAGTRAAEVYLDVLQTQQPKSFVNQHRLGNQDYYFEINVYPSRQGISVFTKDVTERKHTEEVLRQSEKRFRALIEQSADAITLLGADGAVIYEGPTVPRLTGYTVEESLGKSGLGNVYPDDLPIVQDALVRVMDHLGNVVSAGFRSARKDGTIWWTEATATNLLDEPSVQAIVINYRDITERKRAEEALRQTSDLLQAIITASPFAIFALDRAANVIKWSPAAERIFGWSAQEVLGVSNPIVPEGKLDEFRADFRKVLSGESYIHEVRRQKKDKTWIEVSLSTAPLRDVGGNIIGAVGLLADITDRKRVEDAVHALSARHQATLAAVPDIIMEVDNHKVYTWANRAGLEFFGADVIGKEAALYFEGEQETYNVVQPLFNGNEDVIYVESWQRRHDGEKRLLGWRCRTLKDAQGNVTGAVDSARHYRPQARRSRAQRVLGTLGANG